MSYDFPPTAYGYNSIGLADYLPGEDVDRLKLREIFENQHREFSLKGAVIPGMVFNTDYRSTTFDYFETSSGTYTFSNSRSATDKDLWNWYGSSRLYRDVVNSGGANRLRVTITAFGKGIDIRLTMHALEDGFSTYVATASTSGGSQEWFSATRDLVKADAHVSGLTGNAKGQFGYTLEARSQGGTAELYTWYVREEIIDATYLPDEPL